MPPSFTKEEWITEVDETEGNLLPDAPILTVTVHDEDESNKFHYKVIESSGFGADKFTMVRNNDGTGMLKTCLKKVGPFRTKYWPIISITTKKIRENYFALLGVIHFPRRRPRGEGVSQISTLLNSPI